MIRTTRAGTFLCLTTTLVAALLISAPAVGAAETRGGGESDLARRILRATGVRGGLVVHVGCGDSKVLTSLRKNDSFRVQGLATSAEEVQKAREAIHAVGDYGEVTAAVFDGKRLPYADNLVNLIVITDAKCQIPAAEIARVLVPRGAAVVPKESGLKIAGLTSEPAGDWLVYRKPVPADTDDWTHFLHGSDNNAVAMDSEVGPPRRLQWSAYPRWARSHQFISSLVAMVSGGGRLFYVYDEAPVECADTCLPERWSLIARDAMNGILLWKIPLPQWRGAEWKGTSMRGRPASTPRRVVIGAQYLYATPSHNAGILMIDPATGETAKTIEGSEGAQEIVLDGETLVARLAKTEDSGTASMAAFDAKTGNQRWRRRETGYLAQSLAASRGRVVYHNGRELVCLAQKDGKELWREGSSPKATEEKKPAVDRRGKKINKRKSSGKVETLILHDDAVITVGGGKITSRDAETGKTLWEAKTGGRSMRSLDLFVARRCVWHAAGNDIVGYDLKTGEVAKAIDPTSVQSWGHHLRCYRSKATEDYLITQCRGTEFISLTGDNHSQNDWVRGPCRYGVMPANGLIYIPPHQCFCYGGAMFSGFNAFTTDSRKELDDLAVCERTDRLEKGPAYGKAAANAEDADWPSYRCDARRTGTAKQPVSEQLEKAWQKKLGRRLTQPVVSGDRVFVADRDKHILYALSADNGEEIWHYIAGGRIDSSPTLYKGMILFGSADGWVNCLDRSSGEVVWRFYAAPHVRMIVDRGHVESAWRVHGSVLIENDTAYVVAGRSSFLDSGLYLWALEPATGKVLHEARLDTARPTRSDAEGKPFITCFHIEGQLSDILVAQDGFIYLGQMKYDRSLNKIETPYVIPDPNNKVVSMDLSKEPYVDTKALFSRGFEHRVSGEIPRGHNGDHKVGLHLFARGGFLDDSYFERLYWMYAETWPGFQFGHLAAKTGQILVVGPRKTYAAQGYTGKNGHSPWFTPATKGYLLYADRNENEPVLDYRAQNKDKGMGFSRKEPPEWFQWVPIRIKAMVLAGDTLFVAGPPDVCDPDDPLAAFEGRSGGLLWAYSAETGEKLAEYRLEHEPVFDGLIAAAGRLYMVTRDGSVICLAGKE